ncbi:unnamed protein product, partial [Ixodes pacificus]
MNGSCPVGAVCEEEEGASIKQITLARPSSVSEEDERRAAFFCTRSLSLSLAGCVFYVSRLVFDLVCVLGEGGPVAWSRFLSWSSLLPLLLPFWLQPNCGYYLYPPYLFCPWISPPDLSAPVTLPCLSPPSPFRPFPPWAFLLFLLAVSVRSASGSVRKTC